MHNLKNLMLLAGCMLIADAQAATLVPVTSNDSSIPKITHQSSNRNAITGNAFLTNEAVKLNFTLTIPTGQVGKTGRLYIVGKYNEHYYMLTTNNNWQPWNLQIDTLLAYQTKTLAKEEQLSVLKNTQLPSGEFLVFAGYQIDTQEPIFYSADPASLAVFDTNDPSLHRIRNKEVLTGFFDRGPLSQNKYFTEVNVGFSPLAPSAPSVASDASGTPVSQTNIQEFGVDESDRIKVLNDRLFTLETCSKDTSSECLGLYSMTANPAGTKLLDRLDLGNHGYQNGTLYLPASDSDTKAQQIIYLNDSMRFSIYSSWLFPYYWQNNTTEIKFIDVNQDVNQPDAMKIKQTISINSALISSRIVNNVLYLVTRKNPQYIYPTPIPLVAENLTNPQVSATAPDVVILPDPVPPQKNIDSLLPTITFDKGEPSPLVRATDCYVPPLSSDKVIDNTLVTVTAIPLKAPHNYYSVCIAGSIDTFYMSTQAIYLASSRYPYQMTGNTIVYNQPQEMFTEIHKFTLAGDALVYKGSGTVPGHLGWEPDKKPFRMGEYKDILKVATSKGDTWTNNSTTRVSVLQEDSEKKQLKEIGSIDNLGKPGERLYAARFIQNRGYLVTFRITDPLYVLDFSDPAKPAMLGELKINGYSDYLHPIGDNYLLGIGKDAIPDTSNDPFGDGGRGAWYQGVKLSLFDVSSKENLREVNSIVVGKRGTDSAVLSDHHALAWLASGTQASLAIPIELHNNYYPSSYGYQYDYSKPFASFDWTSTGLYTFNIDTGATPKISLERRLIANTNDYSLYGSSYEGTSTYNDRAVIQGNSVHYVHNNRILSTAITTH